MPPILIQTCFSHLSVSLLMDVVQPHRPLEACSGPLLHRMRCSDPITIHTPAVLLLRASEERRSFSCMMLLSLSCRGAHTAACTAATSCRGLLDSLPYDYGVCYWHTASHRVHGLSVSYEMKAQDKGTGKIPRGHVCRSAPAALDINPPLSPEMACCFSRRAREKAKHGRPERLSTTQTTQPHRKPTFLEARPGRPKLALRSWRC
ncbi:hypothetical protein V8C26DRAFT_186465 [Trichoderma gracile]